ncbi:MAG: hypothetical protein D6820_02105 [Lentisphaerae bacterium]|nr:MAG: hypothetical protein D6820_02105 [Lentisphaerota bacterium]
MKPVWPPIEFKPIASMQQEPSGAPYDFAAHGVPERPWLQPYHRMCVTKLCLIQGDEVKYDFLQTFEILKQFDRLTRGLKKLIYLVVFPDHVYPCWFCLDERFKRPQDASAWESLRWLMKEARESCNTLLSLHINMLDAYRESPWWETYEKYDIVHKQKDGTPSKGTVWGGHQSYPLSYYQEWRLGFAQKRIDRLITLLPDLQHHTKSIHIDAFQCWENNYPSQPSPYLGHSQERECETMRRIFRYWRDRGIDVTAEGFLHKRNEDFAGLQPWCWLPYHKASDLHIWDCYPPHIYSTASLNLAKTLREHNWDVKQGLERLVFDLPRLVINYIRGQDLEEGRKPTYPFEREPYIKTPRAPFKPLPKPFVLPMPWREDRAFMIRREDDLDVTWPLPEGARGASAVKICRITSEGEKEQCVTTVNNGYFTFCEAEPNRPYIVIPRF